MRLAGAQRGSELDTAVARAVERALERERDRVEAWLHDGVLQVLALIAAGAYEDPPDARRLSRLAADAADELRRGIAGAPAPEAASLTAEMMRAVNRERGRSSLPVRLEVGPIDGYAASPAVRELGDAVAEALRNAARHSGATIATVRYRVDDGVATVVVGDDGVGFDSTSRGHGASPGLGLGLDKSIVGRLRRAGGAASVDSAPGDGTRITLTLPMTVAPPVAEAAGA